jgi:mRNA-degrading endonuclease RelE of RelBE toxin-antitoxin system
MTEVRDQKSEVSDQGEMQMADSEWRVAKADSIWKPELNKNRVLRDLIRHLPPELKAKIKDVLRSIADDPCRAKELGDELAGLRSYRVARSRVIYRIVGSMVQIVALGPRADIYERAAAELRKTLRKGKTD